MLLINYKTYKESSGENSLVLSRSIVELSQIYATQVVACPQTIDIREVVKILPKDTWAQHADTLDRGRATGWTPLEIVQEAGVQGVILNHSEHKLSLTEIEKTIILAKEISLSVLVFADSVDEAVSVGKFKPDWIGYEPPELVGSKDKSVATEKPEVIERVVKAVPDVKILVGAGVKDQNDVRVSLKLGAKGIGVASGVVLAQNQKQAIADLLEGFK